MTAIELANLALAKIGISNGVDALDESTREAWTAELLYDHILRLSLREFPWSFATKYLALTLTQGPLYDDEDALVQAWANDQEYEAGHIVEHNDVVYWCILAHTNQEPPNGTYWTTDEGDDVAERANKDWLYAYRYPTDCLFARRLVRDGTGRLFDRTPIPWRKGRDKNGLLIYTNEPEAYLEYTMIDCDNLWADDVFIQAFCWKLAGEMAPSLARNKMTALDCERMFLLMARKAKMLDAREQQQEKPGEAEWIEGR